MDILEQFFRFAGISQLLVLAFVLIKGHRDKIIALLIATWSLSAACYLALVPAFRDWHWETGSYILLVGSMQWPMLFWLVARSLFRDDFRLRWYQFAVLIVATTVSLIGGASAYRSGFGSILLEPSEMIFPQIIALAFVILAMVVVIQGWRDDLVEDRRRLRLRLLGATGLYALLNGLVVFILIANPALVDIRIVETIHVGLIFLLCLAVSLGFFSVDSRLLAASTTQPPIMESPPEDFTPIIFELKRLMHEEHVYCEHGLSIGGLAETLGQKEYKLRRVINGEFGYRNFNDFLNQHRITEAARRLVAPETKNLPVLTIAIDVGYSSLGPFNRAFKELLRMTPTQYRASAATEARAAIVSDRCAEPTADKNSL